MSLSHDILQVYETGELTVVGFGGREILDQIDISACREEIVTLVEKHKCKVLAFDLAGVKLIPSGMLGLLASLRRMKQGAPRRRAVSSSFGRPLAASRTADTPLGFNRPSP